MFGEFGINAGYVEDLYAAYRKSPHSVPEQWRAHFSSLDGHGAEAPAEDESDGSESPPFASFDAAATPPRRTPSVHPAVLDAMGAERRGSPDDLSDSLFEAAALQGQVYQLVNAYRVRGHLFADLDPLGLPPSAAPELDLGNFGFRPEDLGRIFPTVGIGGLPERATLGQIIEHLSATYSGSIGVEFTHIEDPTMRNWLRDQMESTRNRCTLDREELLRIVRKLTDAELLEQFIHKNYVGAKRFSLEGAESMVVMLELLVEVAAEKGVREIVIGMAHRGRLNVLVNILGKDPRELFAAFNDKTPERFLGSGDVKYHLGFSGDRTTASGKTVHISLAFNPSHLEWVYPVVEGRVRAKQDRGHGPTAMPLVIHGDAAFMGQGIIAETLNMAGLRGYSTLGTVHLVVNNQLGFTTNPEDSRSTRYCTDIARMMKVPVFHVNGEDPEAVIQVTRLAIEFRQRFQQDVVIDMFCYRRHGHNEGDEPRFTQPVMYALIDRKRSVREMYVQRLVDIGELSADLAGNELEESRKRLEQALELAKKWDYNKKPSAMEGLWAGYRGGPDRSTPEVPTRVDKAILIDAMQRSCEMPNGFNANPKVLRLLTQRRDRALKGDPLDWGTAEFLALASLLKEGRRVRFTGQDVRRGTFAHRHAVLFDTETGAPHAPLAHLYEGAAFQIHDSPLSEAGVLGFEYGYSLDCPDGLVLWEAQFGDFLNTAQVIVDQFISSAEDKWRRLSGITLLLPHGYEGQGPEHSSARIERFMTLASEDNMQLCNVTTPAQYFHVLRRQVLRPFRKPLVIFTPKSLLRRPEAMSPLDEMANGEFLRVIPDDSVDATAVKRIVLCSGKVYYDLADARRTRKQGDVAIVRLEQLYPFNASLTNALARYPAGTPLYWVQEEPRNMGAWYFLQDRLDELLKKRHPITLVSRMENASTATGSPAAHKLEQQLLIDEALAV